MYQGKVDFNHLFESFEAPFSFLSLQLQNLKHKVKFTFQLVKTVSMPTLT